GSKPQRKTSRSGSFPSQIRREGALFFKTLKGCINKNNFQWTPEAESAFQELKEHLQSLPALTVPTPGETLTLYLAGAKVNYPPFEKLSLALNSGRLSKWAIELGEHDIRYKQRSAMKGQIIADFIAESPNKSQPKISGEEANSSTQSPGKKLL
ncbi:hypothetical protein Tco_0141505, partial [Tanacetum coccineum]